MTRVSYVSDDEASETVRGVFSAIEDQMGVVANIARVMGHSDAVAEGFIGTEGELLSSGALGHEILEKVGVAVSAANGCEYCVDAHTMSLARNVDATDEELEALVEGRFEELPERERIAVEFGAAAAEDPSSIPEDVYDEVDDEFTDQEMVEIAGTAALFQGINLFADALEIDPDG